MLYIEEKDYKIMNWQSDPSSECFELLPIFSCKWKRLHAFDWQVLFQIKSVFLYTGVQHFVEKRRAVLLFAVPINSWKIYGKKEGTVLKTLGGTLGTGAFERKSQRAKGIPCGRSKPLPY